MAESNIGILYFTHNESTNNLADKLSNAVNITSGLSFLI
jgi:hypothetical protein